MARKNEAHDMVLESLTEALLQLMEQKPLGEISISELCTKAGVSRISFYRNFASMPQILIRHLTEITDDWWESFSQKPQEELYRSFWPEVLDQYRQNERLIRLLYQNDISYVVKDHIFACVCGDGNGEELDSYLRAAFAGALYGLVDEWIRRGMGDFPENFSLQKILTLM